MGDEELRVRFSGRAVDGLTGAMVARLPTEQEAVGSSPTLGFFSFVLSAIVKSTRLLIVGSGIRAPLWAHTNGSLFVLLVARKVERSIRPENSLLFCFVRYGVVGNMSGSHPVASGSIPDIGSSQFS